MNRRPDLFQRFMKAIIAFSSSGTPVQLPRLIALAAISPNHHSTMLCHEERVGMKCSTPRPLSSQGTSELLASCVPNSCRQLYGGYSLSGFAGQSFSGRIYSRPLCGCCGSQLLSCHSQYSERRIVALSRGCSSRASAFQGRQAGAVELAETARAPGFATYHLRRPRLNSPVDQGRNRRHPQASSRNRGRY